VTDNETKKKEEEEEENKSSKKRKTCADEQRGRPETTHGKLERVAYRLPASNAVYVRLGQLTDERAVAEEAIKFASTIDGNLNQWALDTIPAVMAFPNCNERDVLAALDLLDDVKARLRRALTAAPVIVMSPAPNPLSKCMNLQRETLAIVDDIRKRLVGDSRPLINGVPEYYLQAPSWDRHRTPRMPTCVAYDRDRPPACVAYDQSINPFRH
jgi:hypothetical protein